MKNKVEVSERERERKEEEGRIKKMRIKVRRKYEVAGKKENIVAKFVGDCNFLLPPPPEKKRQKPTHFLFSHYFCLSPESSKLFFPY